MKKVILLITIAASMTLWYSCKKEKSFDSKFKGIEASKTNLERMSFTDVEALKNYYNQLETTIESSTENDPDAILLGVEQQAGFYSLRASLYTDELIGNFQDGQIIQNAPDNDFINDIVRKSILNQFYEVQIANKIYIYYSKNIIFRVDLSNTEFINKMRLEIRTGQDDIEKVLDISMDGIEVLSNIYDLSHENVYSQGRRLRRAGNQYEITTAYVASQSKNNINCDAYSRRLCYNLKRVYDVWEDNFTPLDFSDDTRVEFNRSEDYIGSWSVTLGDGSSQSRPNTSDFCYTHPYTSKGTYNINAVVNFIDEDGNPRSKSLTMSTIIDVACSEANIEENQSQTSLDHTLKAKVWYCNDFFGAHAGSFSHSYKFKNGKWRLSNTVLSTKIFAKFRDSDCQVDADKWETDACNSCKKKRAVVSCNGGNDKYDIANGDVHSVHSLNIGIISINMNLVLNPC